MSQWFPPEPAGIVVELCETLRSAGLDVAVLTGVPNYPTGKVHPGYKAWMPRNDVHQWIPVVRSPLWPSHDRSPVGRALNYVSFALASAVRGRALLSSADASLVYSSPATAATAAMLARRLHGTPYVLMIQDLWPETVLEAGLLPDGAARTVATRALTWFDAVSTSSAAHIIVIAPGMRDRLITRGVPASKITVTPNWVDEAVVRPVTPTGRLRRQLGIPADHTVLIYGGNHGVSQALDAWIDAISLVQDLERLHFIFIGQGTEMERLESRARAEKHRRTHFLPAMDKHDFVGAAADADALIVSLRDTPLFGITIPSKVQSSLALGKAVVASVTGDAARILRDSGAALVAAPEDTLEIVESIRDAYREGASGLAERGRLGLAYYQRTMSQAAGRATLSRIMTDVANRSSGPHTDASVDSD